MSKLLRYVIIYLLLGMAYSFFLNNEASNALKAEERIAIQRRSSAYSYLAKKNREDSLKCSSAELKTKANIFFIVVASSSVMFVLFGSCALVTPSR